MLVDRIDVIHIVLHLRHHTAKLGHEMAEHAGLVHAPQCRLGILGRSQDIEEQPGRHRIGPRRALQVPEIARDQAQSLRVDVALKFLGDAEQADHLNRVDGEVAIVSDAEPPALVDKAVEVAPEQTAQRQAKP